MSAPGDLGGVQQLALRASRHPAVHHQVLSFDSPAGGLECLKWLLPRLTLGPNRQAAGSVDWAVGLTFRGLEALAMPPAYLSLFRRLAPAYSAGAAPRAAARLGDTGRSATNHWNPAFAHRDAHALVTVHGDEGQLEVAVGDLARRIQGTSGVSLLGSAMSGKHLEAPAPYPQGSSRWVHFGYRDGLSRPRVPGVSTPKSRDQNGSRASGSGANTPEVHARGELLLGEMRDIGDNPWALPYAPQEVRNFFRHGSFGVLRQIQQHERQFRDAVSRWARYIAADSGCTLDERERAALETFVRAKLCGRWPDGNPVRPDHVPCELLPFLDEPPQMPRFKDDDPDGRGCPFGAHIRRMNPQGHGVALSARPRPLFRRGMPYGPWYGEGTEDAPRGLLGMFFCSDIEDQFEHLLGEWADRMPMGFSGAGDAKDPLIGAHEDPRATLVVPRPQLAGQLPGAAWTLHGFEPFVTTLGTLYAFYPSQHALDTMAHERWKVKEEEPWQAR